MTRFNSQRLKQRIAAGVLTATLMFAFGATGWAQFGTGLVPRHVARSNGLERAWFARAEINPARSHLVSCILDRDDLFVLSSAGVVQSIDANTGETNWVAQVGTPDYPSLGPAANEQTVGLINGSTLYLLDRETGGMRAQRVVGGPPGGGPAMGEHYVFVPLATGRIEGYPLDDPTDKSWFYQSWGRAQSSPRVTPNSVIWGTDAGFMYVASVDPPRVRYRLQSTGEFVAPAAYREPLIFGVSSDGECFAINELEGELQWKFVTGYPTERGPAAVGDRIYLTTEAPMLHAIDANTGVIEWEAPGVAQFAAATKTHVYGVDRFGTIHVLDRASGAPLGRIDSGGELTALVNDQTDRLFLISDTGLIQCLHEIGDKEPTYYDHRPKPAVEETAKPSEDEEYRGDAVPPSEVEPSRDVEPFAAPRSDDDVDPFSAPIDSNPFGGPTAEEPAPDDDETAPADDDNPFDF